MHIIEKMPYIQIQQSNLTQVLLKMQRSYMLNIVWNWKLRSPIIYYIKVYYDMKFLLYYIIILNYNII